MQNAPRRPGRPSGSAGTELLEIARAEFLAQGYAGTTMDVIAGAARISKNSLYRQYASKDALYAAVVADWVDRGRDAMRPHTDALVEAPDTVAELGRLARTIQAAVLSPTVRQMRTLVAAEATRLPHRRSRLRGAELGAQHSGARRRLCRPRRTRHDQHRHPARRGRAAHVARRRGTPEPDDSRRRRAPVHPGGAGHDRRRGCGDLRRALRPGRRSRLTHRPASGEMLGGAKGTRTPNPLLAKQVRYQLRHGPVCARVARGTASRPRPVSRPRR